MHYNLDPNGHWSPALLGWCDTVRAASVLVSGALTPLEDVTRGRRCSLVRAAAILRVPAATPLQVRASGGTQVVRTAAKLRCGAVTALQCSNREKSQSRLNTNLEKGSGG